MPLSEAGGTIQPAEPSAVPLTLLGAIRELEDGELPRLYDYPHERDYPHEGRTWVRANFIASVDGGATAEGKTGTLAGPGDRLVFHLLRELADVIVVGAGTVRIEGYSGAHLGVAQRQRRQARGQSEVPRLAIVTRSGGLERDMPVFTRTEVAPLVLTCTAAAEETRRRLGDLCEVVDCSGGNSGDVDEAVLLAALGARGMHRILTEGGPMLLGAFIQRDMLDELCLTIAPYLVGGHALRIATGPAQLLTRMRCAHILTDEAGYLYTRYVKA
ncbi:pyrimidine reductase family protein [Mycobacterium sp.]|uniref:pyrimidine reductase family protein n=1 Tax=Mycobacterium sp. TaxID=1785 RepID=UPI0025F90854|nr:pyrimidine reductase family protein [Mycobacterium sp.]MBW0014839.1 pyrimidine reductase family protein [Mycobacterium sp.]